jgi:hypothetical protein
MGEALIVRLRNHIRGSKFYEPPVSTNIRMEDDEFDRALEEGRISDAIESNIPFVTFLVSRFLFQFPWLDSEADELFSIGIVEYATVVQNRSKYKGKSLRAVSMVKSQRKMEEYASGLKSMISCSLTTRYKNAKQGKRELRTISIV